jgi:hypothetical protein
MPVTLYFDLYTADSAGTIDQPGRRDSSNWGFGRLVRSGRRDSSSWGVHRAARRPARTTRP